MSARPSARARPSTGRTTLVAALSLLLASCFGPGDFVCHSNEDCGSGGLCEPSGRCSLIDASCPSGRRYRHQAGAARADQCVGDACPANPVTSMRSGPAHACTVRGDGRVWCWGGNDRGQLGDGTRTPRSAPVAVAAVSGARTVAAGDHHTCAALTGGSVACWGDNDDGQLGGAAIAGGPPIGLLSFAPGADDVAAGSDFSCALLSDGSVRCWGSNSAGQLGDDTGKSSAVPVTVFAMTGVLALVAGGQHACALRDDQTVWCWGGNPQGQLGDGTTSNQLRPVRVVGLGAIIALATNLSHTCAATRADGLWCWGNNDAGQLGSSGGDSSSQLRPARVAVVNDAIDVSAGAHHTCALRKNGSVWCWGDNHNGQLGEGTTGNLAVPVPVTGFTNAASLAAGQTSTCALKRDGTVWCWGDNRSGQLGIGSAIFRPVAVRVAGAIGAVDVAAGSAHTCAAISAPGGVSCWGNNRAGQLGDNTTVDRALPAATKVPLDARQVAAGADHSCARTADELFCWGRGSAGQIGPGSLLDDPLPAAVPAASACKRVAAGDHHSCAVAANKTVLCWGTNDQQQLGDGSLADVADVAAGGAHTCAARADGAIFCWGSNDQGQLGDGTNVGRAAPGSPLSSGGAVLSASAIAAGSAHTCAVASDGRVFCWGRGDSGQLGGGTATSASRPAPIPSLPGAALAVAAGSTHSCAALTDGRVFCWGANDQGQLGDGENAPSLVPVRVLALSDIVQVAAGRAHSCAREGGGDIWCWGSNDSGQLGDGLALQKTTPQLERMTCP